MVFWRVSHAECVTWRWKHYFPLKCWVNLYQTTGCYIIKDYIVHSHPCDDPQISQEAQAQKIYVGKLIQAKRCNWEKFFSLIISLALNFHQFWNTETYNHWSMRKTRCQNKSHLCNKNTISVVLVQDEHFICHITIICTE